MTKRVKGEDISEPSILSVPGPLTFMCQPPAPRDLPIFIPPTLFRDKRKLLIKTNCEDQSLLLRLELSRVKSNKPVTLGTVTYLNQGVARLASY
jgi:hypothetical protein